MDAKGGSLVKELQFSEGAAIIDNRVWTFAGRGLAAEHAFAVLRELQRAVTHVVSSLEKNADYALPEFRVCKQSFFCSRERRTVRSQVPDGMQ